MALILQGNTDRYNIDYYLSEHDFVYWSAPSLLKEMEIGTPVFLWRAGRQAGVIAQGEVAEAPCEKVNAQRPGDLGDNLWRKEMDSPSSMVVGIAIEDVRLSPDEGMLLRSELETDSFFKNATIIRAPQGTVFRLSEQEYNHLSTLWLKKRKEGLSRNILSGITRESILAAINECNKLGQEEFLRQYGYGKARSFYLSYNGKLYDSKAITGVARKYTGREEKALSPKDFSGGELRVARRLRYLGFDVPRGILDKQRNPFLGNYHSWVCSQEGGLTRGPGSREEGLAKILGSDVQSLLESKEYNDVHYPAFVGIRWGYAEIIDGILVPTDKWENRSKYDEYGQPVKRYKDFGDAPNDDPNELQQFAAKVRRGQPKFRENLMAAYGGRCVISNHGPSAVLEAVHISSHAKTGINELDNGLLMRADLHYLFDAGQIKINPESLELVVDSSLQGTPYMDFNGRKIRHRENGKHPSAKYLKQRWENGGV